MAISIFFNLPTPSVAKPIHRHESCNRRNDSKTPNWENLNQPFCRKIPAKGNNYVARHRRDQILYISNSKKDKIHSQWRYYTNPINNTLYNLICHQLALTMSATAWAIIPSSLPAKPIFSEVVAFTDMSSAEQSSSLAILFLISSI